MQDRTSLVYLFPFEINFQNKLHLPMNLELLSKVDILISFQLFQVNSRTSVAISDKPFVAFGMVPDWRSIQKAN